MDFKQINVNNIGYSRPLHTKKGFNVAVNYAGKKPITITTPVMISPYGVDHKKGKCSMKLLITDETFLELMKNIDAKNLEITDGWFSDGETDDEGECDDNEKHQKNTKNTKNKVFYYTPLVKNTIRVNIPIKNQNRYNVNVTSDISGITEDKDLLTVNDIVSGTKAKYTLEWKHIWIIGKTYGYFWTVKNIEIQKIDKI
jgi:hypothetical protein